ncbi:MAG: VTT domain-containing protein [Rickettsiales bacterium]|nr:VTT domain-containing protein [Rickettsiales bacterium]
MSTRKNSIIWIIAIVALLLVARLCYDPVFLVGLQQLYAQLLSYYYDAPLQAYMLFGLVYALVTAIGVPGIRYLLIAAGSILALPGLIVVSVIAGTIGLIPGYWLGRYVLHEHVHSRHGERIVHIRQKLKQDGVSYLFALRLSSLVPNIIINLIFGATGLVRFRTYLWVSTLALLPNTVLYVSMGHFVQTDQRAEQLLEKIEILFVVLAFAPLLIKKVGQRFMKRHD